MNRIQDENGFYNVYVDDVWFHEDESKPTDGCGIYWAPDKPNRNFGLFVPIELPALVEAANCAIEEAARLEYKKLRMISSGLSAFIVQWLPAWKANGWCKLANLFNPYARREPIENRDIVVKLDDLLCASSRNNMVIEFKDDRSLAFPHLREMYNSNVQE